MSGHIAIAAVTAALGRRMQAAVRIDMPAAGVSLAGPDTAAAGLSAPCIGIFLYRVTPNANLRNAGPQIGRARTGAAPSQPAFDLHYLFSFYGDETRLEPQLLLGSAVRSLHREPVISREEIRAAIADPSFGPLAAPGLADAMEPVRLTPLPLSLEQFAGLWPLVSRTRYRLSLAYQGTAVPIDS